MPNEPVAQTTPRTDEVWRTKSGRVRIVCSVDEDGFWVMYRRPAPAPEEAMTVPTAKWREWVAREQARCVQKAWRAA